jgi:hypothetical protein
MPFQGADGKVYAIRSYQTDKVYVGSTTQSLAVRMAGHRRAHRRWKKNNKKYTASFDILELGDAYIELLETCPCETRAELNRAEGVCIRAMNCVNKRMAGRSKEECDLANKGKLKASYADGKVYAIRSYQTDKVYVGSTTRSLAVRMAGHRGAHKRWKNGNKNYTSSFDILELGDAYIELLETCPCETRAELNRAEGRHIRAMNCVNKRMEGGSKKECNRAYYLVNKKKLKAKANARHAADRAKSRAQSKRYRQANREKIKQHYQDNKERIKARVKAYYYAHKVQADEEAEEEKKID